MSKLVDAPFTDKCSVCGEEVHGKTQRGLNQGMGVHKRLKHGIVGSGMAASTRRDRLKAGLAVRVDEPMTPESRKAFVKKVAMRRYQKEWREKKRAALQAAQSQAVALLNHTAAPEAQSHKFVTVCPCCQTIIKTEYQKL